MKEKKEIRVTIRLSSSDYESLKQLAKSTYKSGSISRLIRHYLEPIITLLNNNK